VLGAAAAAALFVALHRDGSEPRARIGFDVLYRPPTFVEHGKPVALTYEVVCALEGPPTDGFCRPRGTLHVRRPGASSFDELPLATVGQGRASVSIPSRYTSGSGLDYYAEIEDEHGRARTVPRAGASAPQHSWTVDRWTTVALGRHVFGAPRQAETVVAAPWGELGQRRRVGPSAFDVAAGGAIIVLDQANRRLAVYEGARPRYVAIPFLGGEGDLAIAPDGTTYVLDQGKPREHVAVVRSYDRRLRPLASTTLAEAPSGRLHADEHGAIVHASTSEQWLPVGARGELLPADEQAAQARSAPVYGGAEVAVDANPAEARFALFRNDRPVASWDVKSATPLGEVQLAEPWDGGLLVVVRVHTTARAEWEVLELTRRGLARSFAVATAEWADAPPGSRFRLEDGALYALQSRRTGVAIVRYDLRG
jgi:hypothetical protein